LSQAQSETKLKQRQVEQALVKLRTMSHEEVNKYLEGSYLTNKIDMQGIQKERMEADLLFARYRNDWTKMGITQSDNPLIRVLVRMAHEAGLDSWSDFNPFGGSENK